MPFGGKSFDEQVQLLNTLQKEVNVVLEQTGRLLATSNANNKTVTAAQAVKLKSILPGAEARFNDALDSLGEELDHAKLILRRDLAIAREREGLVKPAPPPNIQTTQNGVGSKRPSPDVEESDAQEAKRVKLTPEAKASETDNSQPETNDQNGVPIDSSTRTDANGSSEEAAPAKEPPSTPPSVPGDNKDEPNAPSKPAASNSEDKKDQPTEDQPSTAQPTTTSGPESKPTDNPLALDTQNAPPNQTSTDSTKPPDTAITNNADLDSLFGGPTASIPTGEGQDQTNQPQTSGDQDISLPTSTDPNDFGLGDGDFDFGLPTGGDDNDNISALLPGLEDYASAQPGGLGGGGDFDDAIFSTDIGGDADGQGLGDFLDFDFEAELGGIGDDGNGGDGSGEGQENLFNFE